MTKTIVVAIDFSPEAENALLYAADAAKIKGYKLVLFSLQQLSIHALNARATAQSIEQMLEMNRAHLSDVAMAVSTVHKIEVVPHLATGDFYEEINHCLEEHHAALVVMGMASKSIEQDLLGNTTTSALHRLKIPVLAVPVSAKFEGIKTILFACDIVRGLHKKALEEVRIFADDFGASVEVFHVSKKVAELEQQTADKISNIGESLAGINYSYKNVQSAEIIKAIREETIHINADVLIMVPYRHGFWDSIVHRSKTRIMASNSNIPLLSIPL